jgi:tetratricopeptide (TPR) repeat protein
MPFWNFKILPIWILITVFSTVAAYSQSKTIDSLKLLLVHAKEDTNKANILYKIGEEYWTGIPGTIDTVNTIRFTDSALSLAKKLKFISGEINGLMCLGNINAYQYRLPESKKYFNEAIEILKLTGDKKKLAEAYFEIADDYFFYGNDAKHSGQNFPISLDYFFKALKAFEEIGSKIKMAKTWYYVGRLYAWQNFFNMGYGNAPEIEKCALNAMRLYKESPETNKEDIANCNFLLGRGNYFQGKYSKSLELFFIALQYAKDSSAKPVIANDYLNIGRAYKAIGDSASATGNKIFADKMLVEAAKYLNLSLEINTALNSDAYTALCYIYLGDIQIYFKQFSQAKDNLNKAILYTGKFDGGTYQEIYKIFAKLDSAEGNYKLALKHYSMYMAYKESNINEATISESLNYKAQYEFDKREDSLKQKQFLTETKLQAERKQKYFYWAGLVLLALLSLFVYLTFRNQKKINRLASETYAKEKAELELQSLRAQLNPHFIFNCISSIDGLIQNNEKYDATNYLNKFAKLMRNVLEESKEDSVTFSNDIETLKLYLDLEQLRNEDKYSTQLIIPDELLNSNYIVPPLVIQPFVENAIKHGLKNKPGKTGFLKIEVRQVEDHLQYIISDNGIGRQAAADPGNKDHRSYGLQMSADRIKLFNNEQTPSVTIEDQIVNGVATGTTVTVKLKFR